MGSRVGTGMRSLVLVALVGCSGAASTTPKPTEPAPTPVTPVCSGSDCEAKLEKDVRYEPPGPGPATDQPEIVDATPPESATCATVGQVMASIDVGNYAEPGERAPAVAKHTQECEKLQLDQAARTCVAQQMDKLSIAYCAPKLVPDVSLEIVEPSQCDALMKTANDRIAKKPAFDYERKWWEPRASGYAASCKKDRWTKQLADCIAQSQAQYCSYAAVMPLQTAINGMLIEAQKKEQEQRELWAKAYAEPKKYPQVKLALVRPGDCKALMKAASDRIAKNGAGNWEQTWWTPRAKAYDASCRTDRWTQEVGDCVKTQYPGNCYAYAPAPLQQKMIALYQQALPAPPPPKRGKPLTPKRPAK
jgi:hypothetical protein